MAKISIQQKPTFTTVVDIPRVGEKAGKVDFTFAYLDRDQLAEFEQAGLAFEKLAGEELEKEDRSLVTFNSVLAEGQLSQLKKIIKAWGFDDDFNDENLHALVNSSAAIPRAILDAYRLAYQKAREGN